MSGNEAVPVTFVSSFASTGGAEKYLDLLLEELGPHWIRSVICLAEGPFVERLRARDIPTYVIPTARYPWAIAHTALQLRKAFRAHRPAVVHANGVKAALACALAGGASFVWVKHDFSRDGWLARFVRARSARVVAVCEAVTRTFGSRRRNVLVIHNGIPPIEVSREEARRRLVEALAPATPQTIVMLVGRLDRFKGHRDLIAALPRLQHALPGVHVALVGGPSRADPEYAHALAREIAERGLRDWVTLLGYRDDATTLMGGADVVVIPSRQLGKFGREALPFVALEAMAVGTPVVAYNDGGIEEALGPFGLLVPPGDVHRLAEAIARAVNEPELRERLAQGAKERVETEFSISRMVERTKGVYRSVVGVAA